MSGENTRSAASRKKRVQRLKKCIVLTLFLLILTPAVLCVFLLFRLQHMNSNLEELAVRVELLAGETSAQHAMVQELMQKIQTTGEGSQEKNVAGRELSGYEVGSPEQQSGGVQPVEGQEEPGDQTAVSEAPIVHRVYLTFDDGPSANTEKILDILDEYEVKATFFVVGKEEEWAREALVDIVERGHTLGMHSYTHKYTEIYASVEAFAEDFVKLRGYLEEVTGVISNVYRFPGGSSNTVSNVNMREFAEYLDSWGVQFFDWNAVSGDGGQQLLTADKLMNNALQGIEDRETTVILFHDSVVKPTTVDALPAIIENILAMENTVILPITEDTEPVQHIHRDENK